MLLGIILANFFTKLEMNERANLRAQMKATLSNVLRSKVYAPFCILSDAHQKAVEDAFHRGVLPFSGFKAFVFSEKSKGMVELIDFMCSYSTFRLCMMRLLKDGGHKFAVLFSQIAFMMKNIMENREKKLMSLLSGPREPDEPLWHAHVKPNNWPLMKRGVP